MAGRQFWQKVIFLVSVDSQVLTNADCSLSRTECKSWKEGKKVKYGRTQISSRREYRYRLSFHNYLDYRDRNSSFPLSVALVASAADGVHDGKFCT